MGEGEVELSERGLFEEFLQYPPDSRLDTLRERCGDNDALFQGVKHLLLAHGRAEGFTGNLLGAEARAEELSPGSILRNYRIAEELGKGGMGIVYRAEQSEPIQREVALKVVRAGIDAEKVMARFELERQTLARMDHPGIARVYDAGSTPDGRPYFVMELVRGLPITQHADEQRLSPGERLQLFLELCSAVEHAHQKGVIHRDLKPSNVLVAEGDDPYPKVIDFGIAKAVEDQARSPALTIESQVLGTPEYMSPEQARGSISEVDTRSDVYSLGVLLYELLTGTPPILLDAVYGEGLVAVLRRLTEEDPERPSQRAGSTNEESLKLAGKRRTHPKDLQRFLRGDLDRIILKALEKDRDRRYESSQSLAADIGRFLAHKPIEARPPTVSYLARRFVRRHRGLTAGVSLALLGVVGGAVASVIWALRAERAAELAMEAEREALYEAETSDQAFTFIERLFSAAIPAVADGEEMTVRQVVDTANAGLLDRFPQGSRAGARVEALLGEVLIALGDYPRAGGLLEGAVPSLIEHEGELHPRVLSAQLSYADALRRLDQMEGAKAIYDRILSQSPSGEGDEALAGLVGQAELGQGYIAREAEEYERAENHFLAAARQLESSDDPTALADAWIALASCYTLTGRFDQSLETLEVARNASGPQAHSLFLARLESTIGNLHGRQGSFDKALVSFERALELRERVLDRNHPTLVLALVNVAGMLGASGDVKGAEERLQRAVDIHRANAGELFAYARALQNLGNCRYMGGNVEAAVELWKEALEIWIDLAGPESRSAGSLYFSLAEGYQALGDEVRSREMAELGQATVDPTED